MLKYLILDAEMGGRDLNYSLLTAYFLVVDENFNFLSELSLAIKPDDNVYVVSGQGMSVNKIDIVAHDKIAIPYKNAKGLLYNFLKENSAGQHLVPVGHGVVSDIKHIKNSLISEGSWHQFCTYHYLDTSIVLQFLRACKKMPLDTDGSVGALADYFHLSIDGNLHDAKTDALLTAQILKKFIELGKSQSSSI